MLKAAPAHPCAASESEKLRFLLQLAMLERTCLSPHPEMDEHQTGGEDLRFWREQGQFSKVLGPVWVGNCASLA